MGTPAVSTTRSPVFTNPVPIADRADASINSISVLHRMDHLRACSTITTIRAVIAAADAISFAAGCGGGETETITRASWRLGECRRAAKTDF